jgi:protein tyrosine phosphatase (PTP) superfamily phosphohydrolase (DUF442 family)
MKRTTEIYNFIQVNEQVATSGQPTISQLESAAGEGFQTIINLGLLGQDYSLKDEAGLVRSLGMDYYHIPVEWDNPKIENFIEFEKLLNSLSSRNILIHCAANFRASAFYALYALRNMDWSEAQAREFMLPVWQGSNYPVWEKFITQIKSHRDSLLPQGGENG